MEESHFTDDEDLEDDYEDEGEEEEGDEIEEEKEGRQDVFLVTKFGLTHMISFHRFRHNES